ncbi:restriction endonuclease subunit S [Enterococcus avium]|uniref:restriction endonuclease subunit S n=1 Tax=Enterococcus avium TaxID=33945 RepID=UPI00288D588A|nr:restriction endonuclease subunit S [Enterococcus avium]MDT2509209.1 restriction endonuclease subunit S [Enterococcus avium]
MLNHHLEQMARAIFDDMFPNVTSGDHTIGEYITPKRGKGLLSKNAVPGPIPVIAGGLQPATYHNVSNTKAPVLTISASGANSGYIGLWNTPVWSSDSSFIDVDMTKDVYFWYVMLSKRQQEIYDMQTGSAQPHIYPKHISIMPTIELSQSQIDEYSRVVTPLFDEIGANKLENKQLEDTRDTLLPKLMSGEISVTG